MLLDVLPFVILTFHLCDKAFLAIGRLMPVYCLTILGSISTIVYNFMLWADMKGNHSSILLFCVNSSWSISMALCGMIRLVRKARAGNKSTVHNIADILSGGKK